MAPPEFPTRPKVQVIVPARNEEASLGRCLESLTAQQGISFEITVVDDGSTDRTKAIAESFPEVRVFTAAEPPPGVSGKSNALIRGAEGTSAEWLLFTDADTFHLPGALATLVKKAEEVRADLFSISPEQETGSWIERMVQPVVFAELAFAFPPRRVSDPSDPVVAANGQFVLVRRQVYERLGGHKAVSNKILEDVELARIFKVSGYVVWFENSQLVKTRMYRDFGSLVEGWTKNLALLFRHPLRIAAFNFLLFAGFVYLVIQTALGFARGDSWSVIGLIAVVTFYGILTIRLSPRFPMQINFGAILGLPLVAWLFVRSWMHNRNGGSVSWKGRKYSILETPRTSGSSLIKRSKVRSLII
jgi:glycosyltransferase involved in cell wall biosynthesis